MTPATVGSHPSWCDPRYCETDGADGVRHRSAPEMLRLGDDDVEVALHRCQHDEQSSPFTYELHLCHLAVHEESTAELTERDVAALFSSFVRLRLLSLSRR